MNPQHNTFSRRSFTLVELLAVIGILLLLVAITVGGLNFAAAKADHSKTLAIMTEFELALDAFKADYGFYPIQSTAGNVDFSNSIWDNFTNKNSNNKKGRAYMEGDLSGTLMDAYGNVLQYQCPGSHNTTKFDLWSCGKDGSNNTADDIANWKQN
ncbi:MAG: type II secretion system protein GspG [Victivallales bacterium]|nr:type II secretion system protein GspG [Victivallales bacterium]